MTVMNRLLWVNMKAKKKKKKPVEKFFKKYGSIQLKFLESKESHELSMVLQNINHS